ncbi:DoxX-like family protein [Pseudoalteromonas sp. C2R02]|uniref:DoxX-like family protein n=1 Tax=Pseudoalteromonas sp. C2R02 TaxID=2841565 RepID=UPI001C0969BD|nr:DoxX-like family protein [Pseudoalteromonas sp. C2R02]
MSAIQISRFLLSFNWIYHGLFPKLIHIAPLEKAMTASMGFADETSYLITKLAGVGEIIFGLVIFFFYQSRFILLSNIIALIGLLLFVAFLQPHLLIEAFNPVTTNISMIGFSLILFSNIKQINNK